MTSKIYLTCLATGQGSGTVQDSTIGGDVIGYALAEDGHCIGQHLSSNFMFSQHDMGLTSDWKHDNYDKHYPEGYDLEWINEEDLDNHQGWLDAIKLNKELAAKEKVKNNYETFICNSNK